MQTLLNDNSMPRRSTHQKSLQLAVFQVMVVVLTVALWKGWAEENRYLDQEVERVDAQSASAQGSFLAASMLGLQSPADRMEQEHRYHERKSGQPFKLIPLLLVTAAAGYLFVSTKAKETVDRLLHQVEVERKTETGARIRAVLIGACAIIPAWLIDGHANTGMFCAFVIGAYVYWLYKPRGLKLPSVI